MHTLLEIKKGEQTSWICSYIYVYCVSIVFFLNAANLQSLANWYTEF